VVPVVPVEVLVDRVPVDRPPVDRADLVAVVPPVEVPEDREEVNARPPGDAVATSKSSSRLK